MKGFKGKIILCLAMCAVILTFTVVAFASDNGTVIDVLALNNSSLVEESESVPVSMGLDVIAAKSSMAIAGIKGEALYFSAERFACAMNLSGIDSISITRLPDAVCGSLFLGSDGVSVGQKLSASELSLLTYEEASVGDGSSASFDFTVNGSAYEMTCNIYMIDELNYSPTLSLASYASLNAETYCGVKIKGVLSAYDPEGDELKYEIVRYPENGRLVLDDASLGIYTYTPSEDYTGEDSFCYVVCDKYGNYSASAEVSVTVATPGTSTVYSDRLDDALHSHAIAMTECGVMNGIQVGNYYYFEADREVSRAEFVVSAMNAIGIKNVPDVDETGFYDDDEISPELKGYIALAYSKKYISGSREDGNIFFNPNESIKLSEAAVIISNMIGYAEAEVTPVFADADSIPSWSAKGIESLHTLGILEAPDMISGAGETVTRGDMAKLLNKTMLVIGK